MGKIYTNNVKLSHGDFTVGVLWSMWYPRNINLTMDNVVCFSKFQEKLGVVVICVAKGIFGRNLPSTR